MRSNRSRTAATAAVVLAVVVAAVAAFTSTALAAKPRPAPELTVSPQRLSVPAGTAGAYDVRLSSRDGFAGPVTVAVQNLPAGVSSSIQPSGPQDVTPQSSMSVAVRVTVADTVTAGPRQLKLIATSPGLPNVTKSVTLVVQPPPPLTVSAGRATVAAAQGDPVSVDLRVTGPVEVGPVSVTVSDLPEGVSALVDPAQVVPAPKGEAGGTARLTLSTSPNTPTGAHTLRLSTTSRGVTHPARLILLVSVGSQPFGIEVSVAKPLRPGATEPLDVALTNPNDSAIRVNNLTIALGEIDAAHARCEAAVNYAVTQFRGNYTRLVVPARGRTSLSRLGIPRTQWPTVSMIETNVNQDVCKGASLGLRVSGIARGGTS